MENIDRCYECGTNFIGEPPKEWFNCENCGAGYVEYKGKWYSEDEYYDLKRNEI